MEEIFIYLGQKLSYTDFQSINIYKINIFISKEFLKLFQATCSDFFSLLSNNL
jgi:hypothetical protein